VLDLGYPGDAHPHGGGDLLLTQAQLLADLGECPRAWPSNRRAPVSISSGETPAACSSRSRSSQSRGMRLGMTRCFSASAM
jgi:hypothetical protein